MDGIDLKKQSEEIGIDIKNLLSLYILYVEQTDHDIVKMETLIAEKDSKAIRDMAHHIKGASLNLELVKMVDFTKFLQNLAEQNDWNQITTVFDQVKEYFKELKMHLEKLHNEERAS